MASYTSRTPPDGWRITTLSSGPDSPAPFMGFAEAVYAGDGNDLLQLTANSGRVQDIWVFGEGGDDRITGRAQQSRLEGDAGNDTIEGSIMADMFGGDGNDLLDWAYVRWYNYFHDAEFGPRSYDAVIDGGAGDDHIVIRGDFNRLAYRDVEGLSVDTAVEGGPGFDSLELQSLRSDTVRVSAIADGFEINGVAVRTVEEFVFSNATLDAAQMAALAAAQSTTGTAGDDLLTGTSAAERLDGLGGSDWIVPGGGLDTVDGGPGTDTMSFADRMDSGVLVQLETVNYRGYYSRLVPARTTTPDGDLDVSGIENVTGTVFDDRLTGSDGDNILRGLHGNDTLQGLGGARDMLDGGGGIDTASYSLAADNTSDPGVTVSLLAGRGWYGQAAGDVLRNIENLDGSASYDTLTGDHSDNRLYGGFGTEGDILIGNGGDDTIIGGSFNNPDHEVNGWNDVAVFSYDREMYDISTGGSTQQFQMTVRYTGPGPGDGTDTLINIRTLRFADGDLNLLDQPGTDGDDAFYGLFTRTNRGAEVYTSYDGAHNMAFSGGAGNDTYHAGAGADTVDGGSGSDWVDFSGRLDPVVFNLDDGYALSGYRFDLTSIENAIGSEQGDRFIGSAAANHFIGRGGDDRFVGSWGGRAIYDGGEGIDELVYVTDRGGVTVSLLAGKGWTGQAADDVITGIENLRGSEASDILTGDHGNNRLQGDRGADTLIGNAGDDILIGDGSLPDIHQDVAVFSYERALYDISTDAGGTTTVAYTGPGAGDGTDTLIEIEILRFADGDLLL